MSVISLTKIPGSIPRSAWEILIDDKPVRDWVIVNIKQQNFRNGRSRIQVGVPLRATEDSDEFRGLVQPGMLHSVEVRHQGKDGTIVFKLRAAEALEYDLLPIQSNGTQIEGIDGRSDWPVIQAITFVGHTLEDKDE